ncbi:ACP S-malonyltransferase [Niallia taxi]|uniref:ACP S-malonyltransferase n=1 Tax=Niallia taxi TaxID=2499688 RepID=UPI00300AF6AB
MTKIAMLFPGQGSQIIGMGKELYQEYDIAKKTFDEANDILDFNLKRLCFEGDLIELTKTENAQPALLTTSVAMFRVFINEIDIEPSLLAGHSLGEYSALTCSNVLSFSDTLKIVRKRGLLMQQANQLSKGKMVAVNGMAFERLEEEIKIASTEEAPIVIACHNSHSQNVISGQIDAVDRFSKRLEHLGAIVIPLKVSAAFHSPMMKYAAEDLNLELKKYSYRKPDWEVISNVNGLPYGDSDNVIEYLTKQMTYPVLWDESMNYIKKQGVDLAIELGPKTVLKNLLDTSKDRLPVFQFQNKNEIQKLKHSIDNMAKLQNKTITINKLWIISQCIASAVSTKNLNWDLNSYNQDVSMPLKKLKNMYESFQENKKEPLNEDIMVALDTLRTILDTKRVSTTEQECIFSNILNKIQSLDLPSYIKNYNAKNNKCNESEVYTSV